MALLLAWVNIGAIVLLTFACLLLFLDARGQRVALRAAQETVTTLRQRLSAVEGASRARPSRSPTLPEAPRGSQPSVAAPPASARAGAARGSTESTREAVPPPPPVHDGGSAPNPPAHGVRATLVGGIAAPQRPASDGKIANAPPGARRRLDSQMERLWHEKTAAALAAGDDARHCRAARCFQEGQALTACECQCDGCALAVGLLVEARAEVLSKSG